MNWKFLTVLICLLLVFSGCTEPPKEKKEDKQDEIVEETIQEILGKAENITNLEYDEITSVQGEEIEDPQGMEISSTKVFIKGGKFRVEMQYPEQEAKMIIVFDEKTAYMYDPMTDTYLGQPIEGTEYDGKLSLMFVEDLILMAKEALNDSEMKETGKEELNGMKTRIIEFTRIGRLGQEQTKAWISEEHGLPIKFESIIQGHENKLVIEIKNLKFNSVQDSVFEIPEDKIPKIVKKTELNETEEKICVIGQQNIVKVEKCVLDKVTLYSKHQDSTLVTDTGNTTFYDETGTEICGYAWFSADMDHYKTELAEWNPEFNKENCEWEKLCASNIVEEWLET